MNTRFVARGTLLALIIVLAATAAALLSVDSARLQGLDAMPPSPTINTPRGLLPAGMVGLSEYVQRDKGVYNRVGCGFIIRLNTGHIIGVTTAHSLSFDAVQPLSYIALGIADQAGFVVEFDRFYGKPGVARSSEDMSVDYALLKVPATNPIDPALILKPDPRGLPQLGERVTLYDGLNAGQTLSGTVQSASPQAVWVVMDEAFDPSGMSGSPFVSQHTGDVVGMVIATTQRGGRVLLGVHPIGSLVRLAEAAIEFPLIATYHQ